VGLNPYALGMRIFHYIEDTANKGKFSYAFQKIQNEIQRDRFDDHTGKGLASIFYVRENYSDFSFINSFVDQDFMTLNKLFVAGRRLDEERMVWEYYVKSRKVRDYRSMLMDMLYHPPYIEIPPEKQIGNTLYLNHRFEEKPLVAEFIANTLMGIEYLWGGPVQLETSEVISVSPPTPITDAAGKKPKPDAPREPEIKWQRIIYTMEKRKLSKKTLG
jgi:stage V sporulation protein R